MRFIPAFLRLVRWPNLLLIILTQVLYYYGIYSPLLNGRGPTAAPSINGMRPAELFFPAGVFWLVVAASVCVAAAGYIINDYFDLNIDLINKPQRMVVEKIIHRRWAMALHTLISATGIGLSFYAGYKMQSISALLLGVLNTAAVSLLVWYSVSLKKKLLAGNIAIAALSAWVILILYFGPGKYYTDAAGVTYFFDKTRLLRITLVYGGFAFITTLLREVIKDMEDMEGDRQLGCKTMPIVWGIKPAKVYAGVWIVVLGGLLVLMQLYTWRFGWYTGVAYIFITLILPLAYLLYTLRAAVLPAHFHRCSNLTKLIMLAGILSMLFFYFYTRTPQYLVPA